VDTEGLLAENGRLQRCLNDLVAVMALPAMWAGCKPAQIASTLLDALFGTLDLDAAYLQLNDAGGEGPLEVMRLSSWAHALVPEGGVRAALRANAASEAVTGPSRIAIGEGVVSVLPLQLGLLGLGSLVVGSRRPDFPLETERLLLGVAANQAAIGLQAASQIDAQRRLARELDQRVAARTREVAALGEELRRMELDFQLIVNSIPVPVAVTTPAGEVEGLNRPALEYFG
jgi:hypothetical protein